MKLCLDFRRILFAAECTSFLLDSRAIGAGRLQAGKAGAEMRLRAARVAVLDGGREADRKDRRDQRDDGEAPRHDEHANLPLYPMDRS